MKKVDYFACCGCKSIIACDGKPPVSVFEISGTTCAMTLCPTCLKTMMSLCKKEEAVE